MTTYAITEDAADLIPSDLLIAILGLDLAARSHDQGATASAEGTYRDLAGHHWALPTYGLVIGTRVVLWTQTDEAGTADITIREASTDAQQDVADYADEIAAGLDCGALEAAR